MDHSVLVRRPDLVLINKKIRISHRVDFAVVNNSEFFSKKAEKMWVTVIPICVLVMVHKELEKEQEELEIRRRIETIQTTALFELNRILRRILKT